MAVIVMLSLGYNAQASGVTTNSSVLSVGLIIMTNAPSVSANNVTTWKTGSAKMGNKELLALLAETNFANTTFPMGAHLVVGWDAPWSGDVLVVDKSGTNVLFDANNSGSEHFTVNFFNGPGAFTKIDDENNPGYETRTEYNQAYFEFEDDANNTFIYGVGPCLEKFTQKWDSSHNFTSWSDGETFSVNGANSNEEFNNNSGATVIGGLGATGKGKGGNPFLD